MEEMKTVINGIETSTNEFAKGLSQTITNLFAITNKEVSDKNEENIKKLQSLQGDLKAAQRELANNQKDFESYKNIQLKQIASLETQIKECNCSKEAMLKYIQDMEKELKEIKEKALKHETIFANVAKIVESNYIEKKPGK